PGTHEPGSGPEERGAGRGGALGLVAAGELDHASAGSQRAASANRRPRADRFAAPPKTMRYEIRAAVPEDEEQLLELAGHLNTVNLPNDRGHVRKLLDHSVRSFTAEIRDPRLRKYVFVLWDLEQGVAAGTSMLIGQLGRRDAPYIYFDVIAEE